jgi:DNA-binding beta-propeller fold protein YncE/putative cell wall-binding protein
VVVAALALVAVLLTAYVPSPVAGASDDPGTVAPPVDIHGYEIWALDQGSGVNRIDVYDPSLEKVAVIDLDEHLTTPHMIDFDSEFRYAFVAGTTGGGVAVIRTADYEVVEVIPTGAGAHMAAVTPDDSAVWVANIGARTLTEIDLDLDTETFTVGDDVDITADPLYGPTFGHIDPPPAPVCHAYTADSRYAYVTLGPGAGGLVVVDLDADPPEIVQAFDTADVKANCGLALSPDGSKMYANWGAGHDGGEWYVFDTDTHSQIGGARSPQGDDPHGVRLTPDGSELWMVNRASSDAIVIDPSTDEVVASFDGFGDTPDILAFSPDGTRAFVTLRGPNPQSAPHVAVGTTPGFAVIDVASRELVEIVEPEAGTDDYEASDFHGIGVRVMPEALTRLAGSDRIATSIAISRAAFADGEADSVVLARADDYADALIGTPLAARVNGPLLLTHSEGIPDAVMAELLRVLPFWRIVFVLGGEAAMAPDMEYELYRQGYTGIRYAGPSRVETAIAAMEAFGHPGTRMIASAEDFPDALAAGAAAAARGGAVLLTTPDRPHPALDAYLAAHAGTTIAIGGPAARAYPAAEAVSGADRHVTALAVAERFFPDAGAVAVARSGLFADALSGGAHAAALAAPVILSSTASVHPAVAAYLCEHADDIEGGVAFGGTAALHTDVLAALSNRLGGSGCDPRPQR